jgi:hypothetical protein
VVILAQLDGFANGVRPSAIERYLRARGHDVEVVDTYHLSRAAGHGGGLRTKLPAFAPRRLLLYTIELARRLTRVGWLRRRVSYPLFMAEQRMRAAILSRRLRRERIDLLVCETAADAGVLAALPAANTLFDCPTPWADELLFEGQLSGGQHAKLRAWERGVCEAARHYAYWWESYSRYVIEHYGVRSDNLITLNYGCDPAPVQARFRSPLRIVYLGSLSSRFIDLPLLARLARTYPHIDVYGGPPPDPALGLNYIGYAAPDVLADYQAGLITCTDDQLRRDGFSAKHLEYLSHGLPVLVPAWRRHLDLLQGSVPYEEDTFLAVVAALNDERRWREQSALARAQAERLAWDRTLAPLDTLLAADGTGA